MEKTIQIFFKNKGVVVEKWIVGSSSKMFSKTRQFSSIDKLNCKAHQDLLNVELSDEAIICKICGTRLKLVPEWVVGI